MGCPHNTRPDGTGSIPVDTIGAGRLDGTTLMGGRGGMLVAVIGLLIYASLHNGLNNLTSIAICWQGFVTGMVLLVVLLMNNAFAGKTERARVMVFHARHACQPGDRDETQRGRVTLRQPPNC